MAATERGKQIVPPTEEEDDCITVDPEEIGEEDETFQRTLVGKIWTENPYNVRAFKQTITQAWRLKNTVEVQDLQKNLFLFRFSTKKDADTVMRNGPWSFDRNLLILQRVSGDEQPSDLDMHNVSFWVRVYDLPLKFRSEGMAKKLGNIIGSFEEVDPKDSNRTGRFLRLKVSLDLRKPLKKCTKIKFQERNMWVDFKYERLPNFCFACGRIGHQLKECEDVEDVDNNSYSDIEEKSQAFGPWLRASPLPRIIEEPRKDASSGTCSKNLFPTSSQSKGATSEGKKDKEQEVDQHVPRVKAKEKGVTNSEERLAISEPPKAIEVEDVAESLGAVAISTNFEMGTGGKIPGKSKGRKWVRQKSNKPVKAQNTNKLIKELGKRQLVEVTISEGTIDQVRGGDKKLKGDVVMEDCDKDAGKVVLDDQHRLEQ
jgi:interleukin-1 receptor-associated kinase 1